MKYFIVFVLLASATFSAIAQSDYVKPATRSTADKSSDEKPETEVSEMKLKDRLTYGGNFGLNFGDITMVDISPMIGYRTTNKWVNGVGLTYQYYEDRRFRPSFKTSIFGGRAFSRHMVYKSVFVHGEYELLKFNVLSRNLEQNPSHWYPALFVGGGVFQSFGGKSQSGLVITIMYNLTYNPSNSLYVSPWQFRIGFMI